jgi:hypothetical protein
VARVLQISHTAKCATRSLTKKGDIFKTDARVDQEKMGEVVLGGWECKGETPPEKAIWFSLDLTMENAPWVFSREKQPSRMIATLELVGALVAVMLFCEPSEIITFALTRISGGTDNQGNGFCLDRYMSSSYPLIVFIMELAKQPHVRVLASNLTWHRRDTNVEADDLTSHEFGKFDKEQRIPVEWDKLDFILLDEMMKRGEELYATVRAEREEKKKEKIAAATDRKRKKKKKKRKLREAAPWSEAYVTPANRV